MKKPNSPTSPLPAGIMRRAHVKRRIAASGLATAAELIGPINKGDEIAGLTNGQFSLIDIIEHCLECIGPADVAVSTWTMGFYDMDKAEQFYQNGKIRSIRWLVDPSMFGRRSELAGGMVAAFGADAFRAVNTHAKFATIGNDHFKLAIRSSMNLNANERIESFDISEDSDLYKFYRDFVDLMFDTIDKDARSQSREFFDGLLAKWDSRLLEAKLQGSTLKSLAAMARGLKSLPA